MPVAGLHHVLLTVRDLRRSAAFYETVVGLRKIKEIPDDGVAGAKALFALPDGTFFGVVQHQRGDNSAFDEMRTGLDHVAFSVPASELAAWLDRLRRAGVVCSDPAPSAFGDPLIVLRDPDNVQVQVYGVNDATAH